MHTNVMTLVKPVHWITRLIFGLAALLAIIAGIQLFIFTEMTADWFAWTIAAPLSAAFLGAGYWTGATLLLLGMLEGPWANVRVAIGAVSAFIPAMLLTTLLHLDRFHLFSGGRSALVSGWAWMVVYGLVPFTILAIFLIQRMLPGGDPRRERPVWGWLRIPIGLNAAISLVVGVALFLVPEVMGEVWPWALTPLTARAIGGGFLSIAVASLVAMRESDWARVRIGTVPYLLVGALQLLAVVRYAGTIDWGRPGTYLYLLFMLAVFGGGLVMSVLAWGPSVFGRRMVAVAA